MLKLASAFWLPIPQFKFSEYNCWISPHFDWKIQREWNFSIQASMIKFCNIIMQLLIKCSIQQTILHNPSLMPKEIYSINERHYTHWLTVGLTGTIWYNIINNNNKFSYMTLLLHQPQLFTIQTAFHIERLDSERSRANHLHNFSVQ